MTTASTSASARAEGSRSSRTPQTSSLTSQADSQPQPQPRRQVQPLRRPRRDDFWSREYWEERFSLNPRTDESGSSAPAQLQIQDRFDGRDGQGEATGETEGEGEAFEWLGAGEELLTRLVEGLETENQSEEEAETGKFEGAREGPLVLHIGCGSSDVGCRMRSMWEERACTRKQQQGHWVLGRIVNLDYAPSSLALTRQQELQRFGDIKMQHVVADLLSLPSLLAVLPQASDTSQESRQRDRQVFVDGIYDKSTADAISTGPDVTLLPTVSQEQRGASTPSMSFLNGWTVKAPEEDDRDDLKATRRVRHLTSRKLKDPNELTLQPVEMLAYNLAAVTRPGGIWAALSYSATRFDFLEEDGQGRLSTSHAEQREKPMLLKSLWQVESKWSVEAPGDGQAKKDVHAPEVRHWCFLLRRTGVVP